MIHNVFRISKGLAFIQLCTTAIRALGVLTRYTHTGNTSTTVIALIGKRERHWIVRRFQLLWSYCDAIETKKREEIPFSLWIVSRGLSITEAP